MESVKRSTRARGHKTTFDASGAGVVRGSGGCQRRRSIGKRGADSIVFACSHKRSVACIPRDARTICVKVKTTLALKTHSRRCDGVFPHAREAPERAVASIGQRFVRHGCVSVAHNDWFVGRDKGPPQTRGGCSCLTLAQKAS